MVALILTCAALLACQSGVDPRPHANEIARSLQVSLPTLRDLRVTAWRSQDWCRNIAYERGAFSETDSPTTCDLFGERPDLFDDQAERDFGKVSAAMDATGYEVWYVNTSVGADGQVTQATFVLPCPRCEVLGFVYEPGYVLEESYPPELRITAVDADWWYWEEDIGQPG
jgi:hypothetical protein